jgi:hypothetical protein
MESTINALAKRTGANTQWKKALSSGGDNLLRPLYSVDLESVWLTDKPILFLGRLENVATHDDGHYRILVRDADILSPELRLELICPKSQVTGVLQSIRSNQAGLSPGGVGVAAIVTRISQEIQPDKEGTKTVFTGSGNCVEIVYLGDELDLMFRDAKEAP